MSVSKNVRLVKSVLDKNPEATTPEIKSALAKRGINVDLRSAHVQKFLKEHRSSGSTGAVESESHATTKSPRLGRRRRFAKGEKGSLMLEIIRQNPGIGCSDAVDAFKKQHGAVVSQGVFYGVMKSTDKIGDTICGGEASANIHELCTHLVSAIDFVDEVGGVDHAVEVLDEVRRLQSVIAKLSQV